MTGKEKIPVTLRGRSLLGNPLLNKGTAFTEKERLAFRLLGFLPPHIETIREQASRCYEEYGRKQDDLQRHIFLRQLQDENETLFYRLLLDHVEELTPIIYTPVVGKVCERFGHIFRRPRGLYVAYPDRNRIDAILNNLKSDISVIVVTDGERILGLGDQGAGGMGIPIGKLSLYCLCGGICPSLTLPVLLDVGTDNQERRVDPRYNGWCHPRIRGKEYDDFLELFVQALCRRFPSILLQWEDFASKNAWPILTRYRNRLTSFNDDIEGTAAVIVGTALSAVNAKKEALEEQTFVLLGAGSAAFGASRLLHRALVDRGLSPNEARRRILVADSRGLLFSGRERITLMKESMQQERAAVADWIDDAGRVTPERLAELAKPTVLIGATGVAGTFTEPLIRTMAASCRRPVIMPLSNPTRRAEAVPADILAWTEGRAMVATGSPFDPVDVGGKRRSIAQCNNVYIFPAMGVGILSANARRVSDRMFMAAAKALAALSPAREDPDAPLLPPLDTIRSVSRAIATAVARQAMEDGVADCLNEKQLEERLDNTIWSPCYREYEPALI